MFCIVGGGGAVTVDDGKVSLSGFGKLSRRNTTPTMFSSIFKLWSLVLLLFLYARSNNESSVLVPSSHHLLLSMTPPTQAPHRQPPCYFLLLLFPYQLRAFPLGGNSPRVAAQQEPPKNRFRIDFSRHLYILFF